MAIFSNSTYFSVLICKIFLLLSSSLKYNNTPFNLLKNYKNFKISSPLFLALRIKLASIE
jgi:hypothetical protein